jgi:hypothetical protein
LTTQSQGKRGRKAAENEGFGTVSGFCGSSRAAPPRANHRSGCLGQTGIPFHCLATAPIDRVFSFKIKIELTWSCAPHCFVIELTLKVDVFSALEAGVENLSLD